ncbi:hypothetical protein RFI_36306 [Reticulomyxa filosa]|uniref:Uncharacterized protein n=1 Tax=Reticulomyxa filosa TaxID=46433 RepID=X6LHP0_RETFI|nr:hypothetical protein RFI_36306 [Reticulomyxa filosa]|eukprot:ETO01134.1 hypothetical protein RFI_36306 [Reticulomyxa filosa]
MLIIRILPPFRTDTSLHGRTIFHHRRKFCFCACLSGSKKIKYIYILKKANKEFNWGTNRRSKADENISIKELHDINEQLLQMSQREKAFSNRNASMQESISFWISSFYLVLKTESIKALILKLANQRILHKLQFFIESIQKTGIIIETVKKEEPEKIMDLFQKITTLFASTLNQAQILTNDL